MDTPFAQGMRELRQHKKVSLSELARRSGLGRRTLTYWEAGDFLPCIPEFQAMLLALQATPEEATALIDMLNTPRALRLATSERAAKSEDGWENISTGHLLRAMRMRCGMTQASVAAKLGVHPHSLVRWESGETLINPEHLERLCPLLHADPEEHRALREHQMVMPSWAEEDWRKVTTEQAAFLWHTMQRPHSFLAADYCPQSSLFELQVLAMKRHLHLYVPPDIAQRRLLARVETDYAVWLHHQYREQEAKESVKRAMLLTQKETVPQEFWGDMLNLATWCSKDAKRGPLAKARETEKQAQRLSPGFVRTQQVCDMALFLGQAGQHSSARACLEEAERSMNRPQDLTTAETYYFALTRERVRFAAGDTFEISESLLAQCPNSLQRLHIKILWTNALLKEGETVAALRYLTRAQKLLTPEIPTRMHRLVDEYWQQI